ncbi:MAG: hypothetical protein U1D97_09890 [Desulfuromonadales bacterium]|nr:hypothetical protein [Desulfuromonadales bacterium]
MSLQFNYFAMNHDCEVIAKAVLDVFPSVHWMLAYGRPENMLLREVTSWKDLLPKAPVEMRYLVPVECGGDVKFVLLETGYAVVRIAENPVIEYSPSCTVSEGTVRIGRLVYAYEGAPELRQRVQRLFRTLQKSAELYMGKKGLWIFPHAQREASLLQQWVGKPWRNTMRPEAG